mmetsp:Transcript_33250/g.69399  ORF Transcript_33250/g.69399 Transcript_33250/m.69399 type:complete len:116 (-) Transcript_33250:176-523(-)
MRATQKQHGHDLANYSHNYDRRQTLQTGSSGAPKWKIGSRKKLPCWGADNLLSATSLAWRQRGSTSLKSVGCINFGSQLHAPTAASGIDVASPSFAGDVSSTNLLDRVFCSFWDE